MVLCLRHMWASANVPLHGCEQLHALVAAALVRNPTSTKMASGSATSATRCLPIAPCNVHEEHERYVPPPVTPVDLLRGHPSIHLLATAPFLAAAVTVLGQPDEDLPQDSYSQTRHPLMYGPDHGNWNVRREIERWQDQLYHQPAATHAPSAQRVSRGGGGSGGAEAEAEAGAAGGGDAASMPLKEGGGPGWGEPGDRINITCGASYGLLNALQSCTSPCTGYTRRAFMIVPTYFWAGSVFVDAGFADLLTPIPYPPLSPGRTMPEILLDALKADVQQGAPSDHPRVVAGEDGLKHLPSGRGRAATEPGRGGGKRIYKYVLYCVPTYGNPTGTTWDLETRQRVVEIARDWDILVICDDVYDFLPWSAPEIPVRLAGEEGAKDTGGVITGTTLSPPLSPPPPPPPPPPRLVTLDRQLVLASSDSGRQGEEDSGNVLSNCSFSKLLGPGLRCGWQESATPVLARQLGEVGPNRSGGCPSHLVSTIIYELIRPQPPPQQQGGSVSSEDKSRGVGKNMRKIDAIIQGVALALGARAAAIVDAVYKHLPPGSEILGYPPGETAVATTTTAGKGGYFLWVAIGPDKSQPGAVNVREVLNLAKQGELCTSHVQGRDGEEEEDRQKQQRGEAGEKHAPEAAQWINRVTIGHGDMFECPGKGPGGQSNWLGYGDRWVRVAVSWCGASAGVEGIRRLGRAVERWRMGERAVE